MATSLLPTFLASTLHAGPGVLGTIEGICDALTGVSELARGPRPAVQRPTRRARIASGGYLGTAIATAAISPATAVWQVAVFRAAAWISRGMRSPARDTLLVSLVPGEAYGRASGIESAGDNAGALIGPLLAAALVSTLGHPAHHPVGVHPGRAGRSGNHDRRPRSPAHGADADGQTDAVVKPARTVARRAAPGPRPRRVLRVGQPGHNPADPARNRPAACRHALRHRRDDIGDRVLRRAQRIAAISALGEGQRVDRIGPRTVFAGGVTAYIGSYAIFAWDQHAWTVLLLGFCLAGLGIGFAETAETAESSAVALQLPDGLRGNGFGVLGLVQSFGDFGATLVTGLLWAFISPTVAFLYAVAWMIASMLSSGLVSPASASTSPTRPDAHDCKRSRRQLLSRTHLPRPSRWRRRDQEPGRVGGVLDPHLTPNGHPDPGHHKTTPVGIGRLNPCCVEESGEHGEARDVMY